jgi:5-methylcytosine-specific restriction endonuclease McrA
MKYHPEAQSVLSCKSSHYNASKIIGLCEKCNKKIGKEVHHLEHQAAASKNGIITTAESTFHKNNLANLMTLCEDCHDAIHKSKVTIRRKKTTKGTIVL